jgi:hypothetical protein
MLKLNATHQLLVFAGDVNLFRTNIYTLKENTETVIYSSKEVDVDINAEKSKYTFLI